MSVYKYYYNSGASTPFSRQFVNFLYQDYSFFYIGNLIWFILFVISIASLIKIYLYKNNISESALKWMLIFSLAILSLLAFSILLPTSRAIDELTNRYISLNAKGTKILSLALFTFSYLFMTVSLFIISFSVLKRYYFFRAIWITSVLILVCIITVFCLINFYQDDRTIVRDRNVNIDAGIVLGAAVWGGNRPSPVLRERINKSYELYQNKNVHYLVMTGGGSPGEMTEAEVAKQELIAKGIDEKYILKENKSNSTLEQITYIKKNLYEKFRWNAIAIISDNFHLFRSKQICKFYGMNTYTISSDTPVSAESGFNFMIKESFAVILFWLFGIG